MARRKEVALDRDAVMREAFALLETDGLAALSMRALAERLGVQAPALYWHFRHKSELLGLMALAIYAEARAELPQTDDWRAWLLAYGRALRQRLASQRDAAQLCAIARPVATPDGEAVAAPLTRLGLDREFALAAIAAVTSLGLGWASFETNRPMHDYLEGMFDFDASFETGLRALVKGLSPDPAG
jgi:TetR/AcrR family tetracycline transcriptional repressor